MSLLTVGLIKHVGFSIHSFIHSFVEIRCSGAEETGSYELDRAILDSGLSEFGT